MNTHKQKRMYVLVRNDLDETYRCVQGGHALAQYSIRGDKELYSEWDNHTLIYLAVPNEYVLKRWAIKLDRKEKSWIGFKEPDLHDQLTAISCIDTGEIFRKLPLA